MGSKWERSCSLKFSKSAKLKNLLKRLFQKYLLIWKVIGKKSKRKCQQRGNSYFRITIHYFLSSSLNSLKWPHQWCVDHQKHDKCASRRNRRTWKWFFFGIVFCAFYYKHRINYLAKTMPLNSFCFYACGVRDGVLNNNFHLNRTCQNVSEFLLLRSRTQLTNWTVWSRYFTVDAKIFKFYLHSIICKVAQTI